MTALETLVNTGLDLNIYKNNSFGKIQIDFPQWYVKDGPILIGAFGRGKTIEEAARDYLDKIKNQTLVNDSGKVRREIKFVVMEV